MFVKKCGLRPENHLKKSENNHFFQWGVYYALELELFQKTQFLLQNYHFWIRSLSGFTPSCAAANIFNIPTVSVGIHFTRHFVPKRSFRMISIIFLKWYKTRLIYFTNLCRFTWRSEVEGKQGNESETVSVSFCKHPYTRLSVFSGDRDCGFGSSCGHGHGYSFLNLNDFLNGFYAFDLLKKKLWSWQKIFPIEKSFITVSELL